MSSGEGYCHFNEGNHNAYFDINLFGHDLRLRQNPASHNLGHGAVVWDASVVFSKYMECNAKDFDTSKITGKTVLELGSGCGLAGIAFMMRGAVVTCTDMEKVTTSLTDRNVQAIYTQLKCERESNGETIPTAPLSKPMIVSVDWTDQQPNYEQLQTAYDFILLTDCVFSMDLVDDLVRTIMYYAGPKTTVICCHEIRDEVTNEAFVKKLSEYCKIKKIAKNKMHPEYSNSYIEIIYAKPLREK